MSWKKTLKLALKKNLPDLAYKALAYKNPYMKDRIKILQSLDVNPDKGAAKVIMNARTGSVVMNQAVMLEACAISHGNLSVTITNDTQVSQPNALAGGRTAVTQNANIEIRKDPGKVLNVPGGASLAEVVKAMNAIGASPQDLLSILQALKAAGSLRAELEII